MLKVYIGQVNYEFIKNNQEELINNLHYYRKNKVAKLSTNLPKMVSVFTGLMLQEILNKDFDIDILKNDMLINYQGKPYIDGVEIKFNISHSQDVVVLAVSNQEVGIDIELIDRDGLDISKRCFTDEEYTYILESNEKEVAFNRIWTMKEAYLKYTGEGISRALNTISVDVEKKSVIDNRRSIDSNNKPCFLFIDEKLCEDNKSEELQKLFGNNKYGITLCTSGNNLDKLEVSMYNYYCC